MKETLVSVVKDMILGVALALAVASVGLAQTTDQLDPDHPLHRTTVPTITFTCNQPGRVPSNYALAVDALGNAAYRSDSPQREAMMANRPAGDPFSIRFHVSSAMRDRLFRMTEQLNNFRRFSKPRGALEPLRARSLTYADEGHYEHATFNQSHNAVGMRLSGTFQNIARMLEATRKLRIAEREDKPAIANELAQLEKAAKRGEMSQLEPLRNVLARIAADDNLQAEVRARAVRLLHGAL